MPPVIEFGSPRPKGGMGSIVQGLHFRTANEILNFQPVVGLGV